MLQSIAEGERATVWILPILDVSISLMALAGLLPIAGGLPSIASPSGPLSNGIWFTANLCGALLLLASGLKLLLAKIPFHLFAIAYCAGLAILGIVRFEIVGFQNLVTGWVFLALCTWVLLLLFHGPRLWALVGTIWCTLLLGLWSAGGVMSYLSASAPQFPLFLPIQILACVLTLGLLVAHLRYQGKPIVSQ